MEDECVVCLDNFEDYNTLIWCCDECKCISHLDCIKSWANMNQTGKWLCVKCSTEYTTEPKSINHVKNNEEISNNEVIEDDLVKENDSLDKRNSNIPSLDDNNIENEHSKSNRMKENENQDNICGNVYFCGHTCKNEKYHIGNCPPCSFISNDKIYCFCSKSFVYPPNPCGTEYPYCPYPCSRIQKCLHIPTHSCHMDDNCPPCATLTQKWCIGKHKQLTVPCYRKKIMCGNLCKKPLICSHFCNRPCHSGECINNEQFCTMECGKLLKCSHKCKQICHEDECNEDLCTEEVLSYCPCSHKKDKILCSRLNIDKIECDNDCFISQNTFDKELWIIYTLYSSSVEYIESIFKQILTEYDNNNQQTSFMFKGTPFLCETAKKLSFHYNIDSTIQLDNDISLLKVIFTVNEQSGIPQKELSESNIPETLFTDALYISVKRETDFIKKFNWYSQNIGMVLEDRTLFWQLQNGDYILFLKDNFSYRRLYFSCELLSICAFVKIEPGTFIKVKKKKKGNNNRAFRSVKVIPPEKPKISLTNSFLSLRCE